MPRLSATPLLLALAAGAPLAALEVSDDTIKLGLGLYLQVRAEVIQAENADGDPVNATEGSVSTVGQNDQADMYLRRCRPILKGSYQDTWIFSVALAADQWGRTSPNTISLDHGWLGAKYDAFGWKHQTTWGKQQSDFNSAGARTSACLFPTQRPTAALVTVNALGICHSAKFDTLAVNLVAMSNAGDDATPTTEGEGLFYAARVEWNGTGDFKNSKWVESFAGATGRGITIAAELGTNINDRVTDADLTTAGTQAGSIDTMVYGIEALLHLDALTALVEYRAMSRSGGLDSGDDADDVDSTAFVVQAGYAFPLAGGTVLEAAGRFAMVDFATDIDGDSANYGVNSVAVGSSGSTMPDFAGSGQIIDLGVNWYFKGHNNKMGLMVELWEGEENAAGDSPSATAVRLQHQLTF